MSVYFIAEAGVNHNGSVKIAKKLIDSAVAAKCDAIKFQTFRAENLVTQLAAKATYQIENTKNSDSQFSMLKALEFNNEQWMELKAYCDRQKITFLSTPFDEDSADFLEEIDMEIYKIPSGEITNEGLLKHIAKKNKPIILSTGMSTMTEIFQAVDWIRKAGNENISLLHCTSNYPTPYEDVNMKAMLSIKENFQYPVGYSDHTLGIEISIMAASLGAEIIEKHITLDCNMEGPDHRASLPVTELPELVQKIRNVEKSFGNGNKIPCKSEEDTKKVARKSVVYKRNLPKGHILSFEDLVIKRPGTGLPPYVLSSLPGKRLVKNVYKEQLCAESDLDEEI